MIPYKGFGCGFNFFLHFLQCFMVFLKDLIFVLSDYQMQLLQKVCIGISETMLKVLSKKYLKLDL